LLQENAQTHLKEEREEGRKGGREGGRRDEWVHLFLSSNPHSSCRVKAAPAYQPLLQENVQTHLREGRERVREGGREGRREGGREVYLRHLPRPHPKMILHKVPLRPKGPAATPAVPPKPRRKHHTHTHTQIHTHTPLPPSLPPSLLTPASKRPVESGTGQQKNVQKDQQPLLHSLRARADSPLSSLLGLRES